MREEKLRQIFAAKCLHHLLPPSSGSSWKVRIQMIPSLSETFLQDSTILNLLSCISCSECLSFMLHHVYPGWKKVLSCFARFIFLLPGAIFPNGQHDAKNIHGTATNWIHCGSGCPVDPSGLAVPWPLFEEQDLFHPQVNDKRSAERQRRCHWDEGAQTCLYNLIYIYLFIYLYIYIYVHICYIHV